MKTKDIQGLYFKGSLIAITYSEAVKRVFEMESIPKGFYVNEDHPANGYSVVDSKGVQHIYDLLPSKFYSELMNLND
jgi:hypothetical protein